MTMRAVVHTKFGPPEVLHLAEIPRPVPGPGDVLVRVHSTTVNRTDCGLRSATPWIARFFTGWLRPKHPVQGTEFAGVVEAVGADVTGFAPGDRVFGVNAVDMGAHAEYLCLPETAPIAVMPDSLSFDEAAAVCDGMVLGLMLLRSAEVGPGSRIVVYGASGSIGTAAVQLAKVLGAHVTAVVDTRHVDLARDLGADEVIDRLTTDFTRLGRRWDAIINSVGKLTFWRCRGSLVARGTYVSSDLGPVAEPGARARDPAGRRTPYALPHPPLPQVGRGVVPGAAGTGRVPGRHRPPLRPGRDPRGDALRGDGPEDRQRGDPGDRSRSGRRAGLRGPTRISR